ncbi:hypothetical protein [Streptomyces sp. TE4109]
MQQFSTGQRKVWKVGQVAGLSRAELSALFARRLVPAGTPILLYEAMRPVEPVSSWFRSLALERKDAKTMRSYAYSVQQWAPLPHSEDLPVGGVEGLVWLSP